MNTSFTDLVVQESIKVTIKIIIEKIRDLLTTQSGEGKDSKVFDEDLFTCYESHLLEISKWASDVPTFIYNNPKETRSATIPLSISSGFRKMESRGKEISEGEIIKINKNVILVGDPGSGKTTTVKRLITNYFLTENDVNPYSYPILIRLRELKPDSTILREILKPFGMTSSFKRIPYISITHKKKKDHATGRMEIIKTEKIKYKEEEFVGEKRIEYFVAEYLNDIGALVFLDGFDEIEEILKERVLTEIELLGLKLEGAKIILTIRKGEYKKSLNSFNVYEILPLSNTQIKEYATLILHEKGDNFINEIETKSYKDLANRPLFLTFMLILYESDNCLPIQSYEIYKESVTLVLKKWDIERGVHRKSKYSQFNSDSKLRFLSELAFSLTYITKTKNFTSFQLSEVYNSIYDNYDLPLEEMDEVVSEIESHNGLITQTSFQYYEFSHLSIQEYLCATHLSTTPFSQNTIDYFFEYPEPLAIAISISSESSLWFSNLFLNWNLNINNFKTRETLYRNSIFKILNRLLLENPRFKVSKELGYAVLSFIFTFPDDRDFIKIVLRFLLYKNVQESLKLAISEFEIRVINRNKYYLKRNIPSSTNNLLTFPAIGYLSLDVMTFLVSKKVLRIKIPKQ
jgi:predicted NACHT family NTPase